MIPREILAFASRADVIREPGICLTAFDGAASIGSLAPTVHYFIGLAKQASMLGTAREVDEHALLTHA